LNLSYGYLWWLNGQPSFMLPQSQFVFAGPAMPDAPADMFCGLGKNNQLLNVVPSQNLVLVRLGNDPDPDPNTPSVSIILDNEIWQYMNSLDCNTGMAEPVAPPIGLSPNPCTDLLEITLPSGYNEALVQVKDALGRTVAIRQGPGTVGISQLSPGTYVVHVSTVSGHLVSRFVKE
ncbi:MAG: T9SS type A sorting domain-containing protein, partial [Flavobacteriales bacterium]|nr:T9SS type A sorting domain-containing protein [Flavobacteriales bacterium]